MLLDIAGSGHLGRMRRMRCAESYALSLFFIRLFLSLPLLTFLLPFRCHSRSLLPTGLYYLLSCGSRLYPLRGQVGIRTGDHKVVRISSPPHSTCPLPLPPFAYIISKMPLIFYHHLEPSYRGTHDGSGGIWQGGWFP